MAGAPTVALCSQAVGRLGEERRLGAELLDACPGGGEFLSGDGDVALGVDQRGGEGVGRAGRLLAVKPVLVLSACARQVAVSALVCGLGDVSGSEQPRVLGVGGLGVAAGVVGEGCHETRTVVGRGGCGSDPAWVSLGMLGR